MPRGSVSAHRRPLAAVSGVLVAAVAAATVAIPMLQAPTAAASVNHPGLSSSKVLSGVVIHGGTKAAKAFGDWRHQPVTAVVTYTSTNSWANITNVVGQGLTGYWSGLHAHMVWSVPLIPSDGSSSLATAATGAYDSKYAKVAAGLVAGGDGNATIRLGWEMTGDWFAWSGIKNPAGFAGAWRHAVTAMRSVPGAHFTFDFNIAMNNANPVPMYPGDAYVDIIGSDNYDTSWATSYPPSDHARVWNRILTENYGLNWLASFASQHGKRMSMPEWGVAYKCSGHGGGDDPYFVDKVHSWAAAHKLAYEAYFQADDNSCSRFSLASGLFPKAAAEYVKVWSGGASSVSGVPPVTSAPKPKPKPKPAPAPATGLLVSHSATRSHPVALSNARLLSAAYIFYRSSKPVRRVTFSLDGKAYRTETAAVYDLVGTVGAKAKPFSIKKLKRGTHTIKASVLLTSGKWTSSKASFKVGPAPLPLATQLLRVSSAAKGKPTSRLNLAVLHGTKYLIMPRVTNKARASYKLDGKVIRSVKVSAKGYIPGRTYKLAGLRAGLHTVVLHLVNSKGKDTVVKARFRVV